MISIYSKLILISFKTQSQHRASFLMLTLAHFIATFIDIFGIWILFDRFKMVKGWTLPELMLVCGIVHMGFATAEAFGKGFDEFSHIVKNGDFDRVLLRPLTTLFQIATRDVQLIRIGRFLQGIILLIWSCRELNLPLFPYNICIIFLSFIGIVSVFFALFIIQATISFWTVETLELISIATYGGVEASKYPMSIYSSSFRLFFTIIIPFACVCYYPIAIMLHHEAFPLWFATMIPTTGLIFLYLSCRLWKFGVRHYHSTGS
jgi:ABC-2 type transport system permease protein